MSNDYKLVFSFTNCFNEEIQFHKNKSMFSCEPYAIDKDDQSYYEKDKCRFIGCTLVSVINKEIFLVKKIKTDEKYQEGVYDIKLIKEFEKYMNAMWFNKGKLLLAIRDDLSDEIKQFLKILIDVYKDFKYDITYVFCVLETSEKEYQQSLKRMSNKLKTT